MTPQSIFQASKNTPGPNLALGQASACGVASGGENDEKNEFAFFYC